MDYNMHDMLVIARDAILRLMNMNKTGPLDKFQLSSLASAVHTLDDIEPDIIADERKRYFKDQLQLDLKD